jgi:CRP/FNR family transcriptional regulator, cyclic AMP receptor protein
MRDRLRATLLFAHLDDAELDRLALATTELRARAGQALIERGAPGSGIFVLEEGQAEVEAPEGTRRLGPGAVFGERALFMDDGQRTARVRALTDVCCLAIGRVEIERLLAEDPLVAGRLRDLAS